MAKRKSNGSATPKQVQPAPEAKSTGRKAKQAAVADKWSAIENGEAISAAAVHYKPPVAQTEPKKVYPKKHKRLSVGLDTQERVVAHPPPSVTKNGGGGTKRNAVEEATPKSAKKAKNGPVLDKTITLSDSPIPKRLEARLTRPTNVSINGADNTMRIFQTRSSVAQANGKAKENKTVYLDSDSDEDEEDEDYEDEEDMEGLESDDSDISAKMVENMLKAHINGNGANLAEFDEDVDDEEEEEEEGLEDEEFEDEEVDEEQMRLQNGDIDRIVEDDEEMDIDDDEESDDEDVSDEESEISDQDENSDAEGFISGGDREATIIEEPKEKKKKARHSSLAVESDKSNVDFDKFPFSDDDSIVSATRAFAYLISSCDVQTFFDKFYQSNVLVVHRKKPNYYGNLFSTARLVELMEKNHLEYGVNINIAEYKNGERRTLNGNGRVYPQIVKQHVNSLHSVQLVNPQTFDDRIWYLCEILQELFGCFVGANTYLTPAGSSGFAPHWDEIDAFLLQVEGRKYWRVWAPETEDDELPLESSGNFSEKDMEGRTPAFEGWIETGDVLYIPRGFIHQAKTDKSVHSLHVTVSTGRRWSFADLMEKFMPQVISSFTNQRMKLRRGLPIGLFDMSGVVDLNYPQAESYGEKFESVLDRHIAMLRNFVTDSAMESSVDIMAKEFMRQALPPMLTEQEKKLSVVGHAVGLLDDDLVEFNAKTKVRLVRKHTQRLILQSADECFIAHRMANSRLFEGRPEQLEDFPIEGVDVFTVVSDAYPEWRSLEKIFSSEATQNIPRKNQLAAIQRLYQIGVLLVKN